MTIRRPILLETHIMQAISRPVTLFGSLLALILGLGATVQAQAQQAPFGNKVSAAIPYYNRATPFCRDLGTIQGRDSFRSQSVGIQNGC